MLADIVDFTEYTKNALRTESPLSQDTRFDFEYLFNVLKIHAAVSDHLDMLKKSLFYGKKVTDLEMAEALNKIRDAYSKAACATYGSHLTSVDLRLVHGLLGSITESGELADRLATLLKDETVTDKDVENILEESGDMAWYQALTLSSLGARLAPILDGNIAKLRARYPEKFTQEAALNRNIAAEIDAMTGAIEEDTQGRLSSDDVLGEDQ